MVTPIIGLIFVGLGLAVAYNLGKKHGRETGYQAALDAIVAEAQRRADERLNLAWLGAEPT